MKNYKGYYIDKVIFHNEEEIDEFLKIQAIESYKTAILVFASHPTMEASGYCEQKAERLVRDFGFTWEQVEEIEINTLQAGA